MVWACLEKRRRIRGQESDGDGGAGEKTGRKTEAGKQASTLTAGPAAFSLGGPVDLALHWPEGASERKFGPQGCSFCAGPKGKSDRDVVAICVIFRRLERFPVHFRRMTNKHPVDGDRNIALSH